jgi:tellurite methyltransferase
MADTDREHWNRRYQEQDYDFAPSAWLTAREVQIRPWHPGQRALDLASGGGRHALYLASLGYAVDAWDISSVALDLLGDELARRALACDPLAVTPRCLDLERVVLPASAYDLVLDAHYLDRALFAGLARALRPGGLLIVHTFLYVPGGPMTSRLRDPAHALQAGELQRAFGDLEILDLAEDEQAEEAHLLARQPSAARSPNR